METLPIIKLLGDGAFHSGEELGARLGVSRTAVWNHVQAVRELGITVDAVRGKGYRVPGGVDLLDAERLRRSLLQSTRTLVSDIELFDVIDSTNAAAISRLKAGGRSGYACFAEGQTGGRGRRGRSWLSPYGRAIYFTYVHEFQGGFSALDGLSLVVGVAAAEAMESLGCHGVMLKWPNDLLLGDQKVGGILIEVFGDIGGSCQAVIGIGINVDLSGIDLRNVGQPATDLIHAGLARGRRNDVALALLSAVPRVVAQFDAEGLGPFLARWARFDCLQGAEVEVLLGSERIAGVVEAIDGAGALVVRTSAGPQVFRSGEVSVRGRRDPAL